MQVHGREVGFRFTVGASVKISNLCPDGDITSLGEVLKDHRQRCQMTQEFVAENLGVSRQAVSKWETGAALPDVALIPAIAGFFEVSTDELFDFTLLEQERNQTIVSGEIYCIHTNRLYHLPGQLSSEHQFRSCYFYTHF